MYLQAIDSVVLQVYAMGMDVRTFVLCCYIYRRADPELLKLKLDLSSSERSGWGVYKQVRYTYNLQVTSTNIMPTTCILSEHARRVFPFKVRDSDPR